MKQFEFEIERASESGQSFPRITVGVTCYNAEHSIQRAIRSALDQDWPNLEIVVVDDASKDRSWSLIKQIAGYDHRVRLVRHDGNQGAAFARNSILQVASGAFIAFFDDDDVSRPDRLRLQYERILAHEQTSGCHVIGCYASGEHITPMVISCHYVQLGLMVHLQRVKQWPTTCFSINVIQNSFMELARLLAH